MTATMPGAAPVTAPDTAAATGQPGGPEGGVQLAPDRDRARRRRRLLLWAVIAIVLSAIAALVAGMSVPSDDPFDPDNPGDDGLQALHRVLQNEGVDIQVVRGITAFENARVDEATTVLVVGTQPIIGGTSDRFAEHSGAADSVVLLPVPTGPNTPASLDLDVTLQGTQDPGRARAAECTDPLWRQGETLTQLSIQIRVNSGADPVLVCFPPNPGYNLGGAQTGHLVRFDATSDRPETVIFGGAAALTNQYVTEEANAAAGLRLLGGSDRLVWYIPLVTDGLGDEPVGLAEALPRGFLQAAAVLGFTMLVVMFWRGRRMGPLVTENLPAVIRSVETTQARSRLYRKANDRSRALASLQFAARRRLAVRLGLPKTAPPEAVVRAVADYTGRNDTQVHRLLVDNHATDDATLVSIARELRDLEEGIMS